MGLFNFLTQEIAIDLGTANTLIIHNDKVVVDEPSIVAKDRMTGKIIAVGKKETWPVFGSIVIPGIGTPAVKPAL